VSKRSYDLICIGSGPAGQRAAIQAAKLGGRAAVVEKRRVIGGVCLDTGTIPSKTLREAVIAHLRRVGGETRGRRQRPGIDELLARVHDVIEIESEIVEDKLARNDVDLIRGKGAFTGPHSIQVIGESGYQHLEADRFLVAVGTRPVKPPRAELGPELLIDSDAVIGMDRLPRHMTVVGAGVIGLEYASMFAEVGVEVTVLDRHERPLPFLDREIVDELIHQMRGKGVTFRLGETVSDLERVEGPRPRIAIEMGSGKRHVSDLVLYSAGRVAATDKLCLDLAGLDTDENGRIAVNEFYQSAVPHIYAAGDVIGYPSLAATAMDQGRLAALHAFGAGCEPMAEHFPVGIYSIPEISMVGRTEQDLTELKIPYETGIARYREIARGQILQDDSGFFKMLFHRETRQLLGVHAIGTGATELIHIGQAVLGLGGGLDYFLKTVFNYPTLAECYKVAALDAANKLSLAGSGEAAKKPTPAI